MAGERGIPYRYGTAQHASPRNLVISGNCGYREPNNAVGDRLGCAPGLFTAGSGVAMPTPIYVDEPPGSHPPAAGAARPEAAGDNSPDRVRRLEEEVFALRDTMSRFAELVLGELKHMRQPGQAPEAAP